MFIRKSLSYCLRGCWFVEGGHFRVMPEVSLASLDELFRARVITFLVKMGLQSPERANMLRGWKHSGFNIHSS